MLEVVPDMFGQMKQPVHESLDARPDFSFIVRQALGIDVPLQILVEVFIRVRLRRSAWQPEQFQAVLMGCHPRATASK